MLSATDGEEETFGRALRHNALKERGFPVTVFGAKKTLTTRSTRDLGLPRRIRGQRRCLSSSEKALKK